MSSSVAGIKVGMAALLDRVDQMASMDWRVAPVPWRHHLATPGRPLKVGYYTEDGIFPPTPGMVRGVEEAVQLLQKAGHQVEQWRPPGLTGINSLWGEFVLADHGHYFRKGLAKEQVDQSMIFVSIRSYTPALLHWLAGKLLNLFSPSLSRMWSGGAELTRDLWLANGRKDAATYQLTRAWEEKGFDVLICPAFSFPAPPPQYPAWLMPGGSYVGVWNVAGNPAGVIPVTKENSIDQANLDKYPVSGDICHRWARDATRGATGCPIGIQVVGRHFQEEVVIHAMQTIEELVQESATN